MGGFFGATSRRNCILDVFFGTDYHSHLGTRRGGMAAWDKEIGMQREIHNIQNSPFRTKFEGILDEMTGTAAIGCISDTDPQPILIRSRLGVYAICTVGIINNAEELIDATSDSTYNAYKVVKYCSIVVATVPILVIYPFIQKYFAKGVNVGGVKE